MARSLGDVLHLFLDDASDAGGGQRLGTEPEAEATARTPSPAPSSAFAVEVGSDAGARAPIVWIPVALDDAAAADAVESWSTELATPTRRTLVASPLGAAPDAWRHRPRPPIHRAILARDGRSYGAALARLVDRSRPDCVLARIPTGWLDAAAPANAAPRILLAPAGEPDASAAAAARWTAAAPEAVFGLDVTGRSDEAGPWIAALERRGVQPRPLRSATERRDWLLGRTPSVR